MKKFIYYNADGYHVVSESYESSDFVAVGGIASANAPVLLNAAGELDDAMVSESSVVQYEGSIDHNELTNTHNLTTDIDHNSIANTHNLTSDIDHGNIAGLTDDDHTQYSLADGSRDFSGIVAYDSAKTFSDDNDIVSKKYVDDAVVSQGINYTAATAIAKGDLVYISANDSVSVYSDISVLRPAIGVAAAAANIAETVKILADDSILDGLSGLTAGNKYFWTGSGWTSNFGSFSAGEARYLGGVAKNATSVHVDVEFLGVDA